MQKGSRIGFAILGIILLVAGIYEFSKNYIDFRGTNETETQTQNKTETQSQPSVIIGEMIDDKDGVNFCVTQVDNVKSVGSGYAEATTDYNFVVLSIKITNKSNEPYDVNALRFLLTDGENEYEYSNDALFAFDNPLYLDTINPDISKEYMIAYETSTTTIEKEYKLKIEPVGFFNDDSVFIALKEA